MRRGIRLGVDVGTVRIGVARSDPDGTMAVPVETVRRARDGSDLARLVALIAEYEVVEALVGHPAALSGRTTASTEDAVRFARRLAATGAAPVRLVDERLSTVSAAADLRAAGVSTRRSRGMIDQAAATVILQTALDVERSTGRPPGEAVPTDSGKTTT